MYENKSRESKVKEHQKKLLKNLEVLPKFYKTMQFNVLNESKFIFVIVTWLVEAVLKFSSFGFIFKIFKLILS